MPRRRRRSIKRTLLLAVGVAGGLVWLWAQPWGPTVLYSVAAFTAAGALTFLATASRRRQHRLRRLATMNGLLGLTPLEFEHEIADLLWSLGFSDIHVTGMAGDLQADILVTDPEGLSTIVQCKRYAADRSVGSPVIQSFIGMARIHHDCDRAIFVTTGTFTRPACELAEEHDVELIDGYDLVQMYSMRTAASV